MLWVDKLGCIDYIGMCIRGYVHERI